MGKPHKGVITNWQQRKGKKGTDHLGWYYTGVFQDHPIFAGRFGHTAMVVGEEYYPDGSIEIETLNFRYTLR